MQYRGYVVIEGMPLSRSNFTFDSHSIGPDLKSTAREALLDVLAIDFELETVDLGRPVGLAIRVEGYLETDKVGSRMEFEKFYDRAMSNLEVEDAVLRYIDTLVYWGWEQVH